MKNRIKEETPVLHNLLNEDAHDFGTQNAHGFPTTGRHLAPNLKTKTDRVKPEDLMNVEILLYA